jgi:hypothetical protein
MNEHEKLSPDERQHFIECSVCGEMFDRRSLDEVLLHESDHRPRPDIQYRGLIGSPSRALIGLEHGDSRRGSEGSILETTSPARPQSK